MYLSPRDHFCPGAGVIFTLRLRSSVWVEHAVILVEAEYLDAYGKEENIF